MFSEATPSSALPQRALQLAVAPEKGTDGKEKSREKWLVQPTSYSDGGSQRELRTASRMYEMHIILNKHLHKVFFESGEARRTKDRKKQIFKLEINTLCAAYTVEAVIQRRQIAVNFISSVAFILNCNHRRMRGCHEFIQFPFGNHMNAKIEWIFIAWIVWHVPNSPPPLPPTHILKLNTKSCVQCAWNAPMFQLKWF